jgi:hypothetical protein
MGCRTCKTRPPMELAVLTSFLSFWLPHYLVCPQGGSRGAAGWAAVHPGCGLVLIWRRAVGDCDGREAAARQPALAPSARGVPAGAQRAASAGSRAAAGCTSLRRGSGDTGGGGPPPRPAALSISLKSEALARAIWCSVVQEVSDLLEACLSQEPGDRPTAQQVLHTLGRLVERPVASGAGRRNSDGQLTSLPEAPAPAPSATAADAAADG